MQMKGNLHQSQHGSHARTVFEPITGDSHQAKEGMDPQSKRNIEGDNDGSGADKFLEAEHMVVFLFKNPLAVKHIEM